MGLVVATLVLLGPLIVVSLLFADGARFGFSRVCRRYRSNDLVTVVAAKRALGAEAVSLELRRPLFGPLPRFEPGQHVILSIPDGDGPSLKRAYSISRWQRLPWTYELSIKRATQGRGSSHLVERVQVGDRIRITRPGGAFTDPGGSQPLVLIAAGIGITPFRAMVHARVAKGRRQPVHLHVSANRREGHFFHEELVALAREHDWFSYFPRVTGDAEGWTGARGRITAAEVFAIAPFGAIFMVCAGREMENDLTSNFSALGVPAKNVLRESFGISVQSVDVEGTVRVGDRSFKIGRVTTLLDVLERNRVAIASECRAGECGCCEVELESGTVRQLLTGEKQTGRVLACSVVPEGDIVLRSTAVTAARQ